MSKIGWLNNRRYKLPEDTSFLLNDLDAKDEEIARLRAALEDIADGLGETDLVEVGRYAKHIARAALEGK